MSNTLQEQKDLFEENKVALQNLVDDNKAEINHMLNEMSLDKQLNLLSLEEQSMLDEVRLLSLKFNDVPDDITRYNDIVTSIDLSDAPESKAISRYQVIINWIQAQINYIQDLIDSVLS